MDFACSNKSLFAVLQIGMLSIEYPQVNMQKEDPGAHQQLLALLQQQLTSGISSHEQQALQQQQQLQQDKQNAFTVSMAHVFAFTITFHLYFNKASMFKTVIWSLPAEE